MFVRRNITVTQLIGVAVGLVAGLVVGPTARAQGIDDLARLMQGRFDSHPPGLEVLTSDEQRLIDSRQRVDAPELGNAVFYLQLNQGPDLTLYRQRILILSIDPADGSITQRAYTLRSPERFVDSQAGDAVLQGLDEGAIEPMFQDGCGQRWKADGDGFRGYTDPATCRIISSRTGKPRRIEAVNLLTIDALSLVERGYDDEMNQLFGTPQGESTKLIRIE